MAMKTIKIMDGLKVITDDKIIELKEGGFPALWDLFGWDIENDPNAKECATIITRELFCFGQINLSHMNNGKLLLVEVIPVKEGANA